jgi:superfamily II DNA or RNA helicase
LRIYYPLYLQSVLKKVRYEETCPLITPYTTEKGIDETLLNRLYLARKHDLENDDPLPFSWPSRLRTILPDGKPLIIREYQKQQIFHHTRLPRYINGDAVGLGKTVDVIASLCWLLDRRKIKTIVVTTRSTTYQWKDEVEFFSELRPFVLKDNYQGLSSYPARFKQLEHFLQNDDHDVLITKYSSLIGKRKKKAGLFDDDGNPLDTSGKEYLSQEIRDLVHILKPHKKELVIVFDEAHRFKGNSQTRKLVLCIAPQARQVWALTATGIKNRLTEFYSIASGIGVRPFGSVEDFENEFCIYYDQHIGFGRTKRTLRGYTNIPEFKQGIRPFFLGRSQSQVKEPLPKLSTRFHSIDLSPEESKLLLEDIPQGKVVLPPILKKIAEEEIYKDRDPDNLLTMMSIYQLVANSPALLYKNDPKKFYSKKLSSKEKTLLELTEDILADEKIIIYSKFRTHIDRLDRLTKEGHFGSRKFLRITGAEDEKKRNENKKLFQDPSSPYDQIYINDAAIEGVNLQQGAHMILLDLPWSWGNLIQLVGRMVRMASPHSACTLHAILAKGTIDEYGLSVLRGKKGVFEAILGQSHSAGILDDGSLLDLDSGMESDDVGEFTDLLKAHVKPISIKNFIQGNRLSEAQSDEDYKIETKPKKLSIKEEVDKFKTKW